MITDNGKLHVKRYMAKYVPSIGESIAFGIGGTAEAGTDTSLNFEVARAAVNLLTYDYSSNKLIFKATVPPNLAAKFYEVGLYSNPVVESTVDSGSRMISTFGSEGAWEMGGSGTLGYSTASTRIGAQSLSVTSPANQTVSAAIGGMYLDFSNNASTDAFKLAINVVDNNANFVGIRFRTSASSYFQYAWDTPVRTSGYKILEVTKDSFTPIGTIAPTWDNITSIMVYVVSKTAGPSVVEFDSIRVDDKINTNSNILVARRVLSTPVTSIDGQAQDIEFALDINV